MQALAKLASTLNRVNHVAEVQARDTDDEWAVGPNLRGCVQAQLTSARREWILKLTLTSNVLLTAAIPAPLRISLTMESTDAERDRLARSARIRSDRGSV